MGTENYRCMQQISRERVQGDIDTLPICGALDLMEEVDVPGAVDVLSGNTEIADQMLNLFLVAYRCKDLRADHAADVDGCGTDSSTSRMDQNTLSRSLADSLNLPEIVLNLPAQLRVEQAQASHARLCRRHRAWWQRLRSASCQGF